MAFTISPLVWPSTCVQNLAILMEYVDIIFHSVEARKKKLFEKFVPILSLLKQTSHSFLNNVIISPWVQQTRCPKWKPRISLVHHRLQVTLYNLESFHHMLTARRRLPQYNILW